MDVDDLAAAWDVAEARYSEMDAPVARFNVALLRELRPRWEAVVRPDTSMFTVLFTRPGILAYGADELVEVLVEAEDRVRMALIREVPRREESGPAGPMTVTGDFTKPENAVPAVEALLFQITRHDG